MTCMATRAPSVSRDLVQSLFEPGAPLLYRSTAEELAAVARGLKGICSVHRELEDAAGIASFIDDATKSGLTVSRRQRPLVDREFVELCATRPGEEVRAEVYAWVFEARASGYGTSETSSYFRSRALGYSYEQAAQWIEMCRHRSPVHGSHVIYLLLPLGTAKQISAGKGSLVARRSFTIAWTPGESLVLRRDALTWLPRQFAIGRAAISAQGVERFFTFEPGRISVRTCTVKQRPVLARSLQSPIDFWNGTQWAPRPRSS
jgi:hypothetical protein